MTVTAATAADATEIVALWEACGLTRPWNDPHADFARAIGTPTTAMKSNVKGTNTAIVTANTASPAMIS